MLGGWIKVHRILLDKAIWKTSTAEQKVILLTLLLMANHEENEWVWQGKKFLCKPGQFISSLNSIAQKAGCGITIKQVRTAINKFEKYEFLANESTTTGRLISIINWDLYQSKDDYGAKDKADNRQSIGKQGADGWQSKGSQRATNKNDKNDKNEKNDKKEISQKFDLFWNIYPKKVSEVQARKNYESLVKKSISEDEIIQAAKNYAKYVKSENVLNRYIIEPQNFLGQAAKYKDWVDKGGEELELKPFTGDEGAEPEPFAE